MALKITVRKLVTELGYEVNEAALIRYKAQLASLKGQLRGASKQTAGLGQTARGKLTGGLNEASRSAGGLTDTLGGLKGIIAGVVGGLLVGGLTALVTKTIEANAEFENLNASLVTVTGSEEAAAQAFKLIETFAARTPYSLGEVVTAFTKLKALGLDPSEAALESYGNTASAMGKGLNDMIEAVADATTGEFERLKEFGIKSKSEGNNVSFTFQGVTTKVGKNAKEIEAYLRKIGQVQFAGGMDRQSRTLKGLWSTLQDSIDGFFRAIGKAGVNDALRELLDVLIDGAGGGESFARTIGKGIVVALHALTGALRFAKDHANELRWVLKLFALNRLGLAIALLTLAISPLILAFIGLTGAMIPILVAMVPITLGLLLLGLVVEDLYTFFTGGKSVFGDFVDELMKLGVVRQVVAWFQRAARVWGAVFRILGMVAAGVFDRAQGAWMGFTAAVDAGFGRMLSGGRDALKWLAEAFGLEFGGIEDTVGAVFERIDAWIAGLLDKLDAFAGPLAKLAGVDVGAIKRELDIIKGVPGAGANAGAIGAANARGIANGVTSMATNVGSVTVQVAGSTGMGPSELAASTEKGVRKGVAGPLRSAQ